MSAARPSPQLEREHPDPREDSHPLPRPFVAFFAVTAVVALVYLVRYRGDDVAFAGDQRSPQRTEPAVVTGESAYHRSCAACHQASGHGVPGVFPPLASSPWLVDDRETPIRVVLLGLTGPIDVGGRTYAASMPALGALLSDREVAAALTHARTSFGNQASEITESDVGLVRASLGGRTEPWAGGAALDEARKTRVLP